VFTAAFRALQARGLLDEVVELPEGVTASINRSS